MRLLGVSGCEPVDPVASRGFGAYPVNVGPLGYSCISCKSVSEAIELTYPEMERQTVLQQLRTSLGAVLDKVLANRNATLAHLAHAISEGSRSSKWQRFGELLLLYRPEVLTESIELPDYDGSSVSIPLDTELSIIENANAYFERAKRAKQSAGTLVRQKLALENEIDDLESAILAVELCGDVRELEQLKLEFQSKRWVQQPNAGSTAKEERPFQGHRIREVLGPGNVQVLYGENAEANDFLTLKVAKPNDFWFHVRGATSAHVVLRTNNQPQKIQPDQLRFAAEIAVRNSSQKHAKYVPVDYTLKKYVRKPKGAARGSATYTLEKTLFVDLP
jgi:predicted ribosome quality control (RQC) complex YloA/Tae2 family protein